MRTALLMTAVAVVSCLFLSCGPKEPDMASLKKTVDEFNAASKEALMGGSTDKLIGYYEENAMEMPPNMAMIKGRDAIKAFWDQSAKAGMKMSAVEFTSTDVQASGTIAYEIGNYDMTLAAGKMGAMNDKGKYITLWREQADGTWKVVAETWNTDKPMPVVEKSSAKKSESKHKVMSKKAGTKKAAVSKKSVTKKKPVAKKPTTKKTTKKSTTKRN